MRSTILAQKRAKGLRRALTVPERVLWQMLRRNQQQLHFRRQHAVGPYILDFYCAAAKLCVEVDGTGHEQAADHDEQRTRWLNGQGIRVLRFSTEAIEMQPAAVIATIAQAAAPSTA